MDRSGWFLWGMLVEKLFWEDECDDGGLGLTGTGASGRRSRRRCLT